MKRDQTTWLIVPGLIIVLSGILLFPGLRQYVTGGARGFWSTTSSAPITDQQRTAIREQAAEFGPMDSFVVVRDGRTVVEYYDDGFTPESRVNIKSASKSVLSALVGIALRDGHLDDLDHRVDEFFPDHLDGASEEKQSITLRDLLLMRSGLESTSFEEYGPWVSTNHWLRNALSRPLVDPPGTKTQYSTGNSHIVAAILSEATGRDLRRYAQKRLFDPMGVRIQAWQRSPEGYRFGGNNLSLTTEGMVRFGRLYLNEGVLDGQRVLSADWVRESTGRIVTDTHNGYPYGYFWWNTRFHGLDVTFAWGHGGQYIFIIPDRDMVVVTTSDLQSVRGTDNYTESVHSFMETMVVPATIEQR